MNKIQDYAKAGHLNFNKGCRNSEGNSIFKKFIQNATEIMKQFWKSCEVTFEQFWRNTEIVPGNHRRVIITKFWKKFTETLKTEKMLNSIIKKCKRDKNLIMCGENLKEI